MRGARQTAATCDPHARAAPPCLQIGHVRGRTKLRLDNLSLGPVGAFTTSSLDVERRDSVRIAVARCRRAAGRAVAVRRRLLGRYGRHAAQRARKEARCGSHHQKAHTKKQSDNTTTSALGPALEMARWALYFILAIATVLWDVCLRGDIPAEQQVASCLAHVVASSPAADASARHALALRAEAVQAAPRAAEPTALATLRVAQLTAATSSCASAPFDDEYDAPSASHSALTLLTACGCCFLAGAAATRAILRAPATSAADHVPRALFKTSLHAAPAVERSVASVDEADVLRATADSVCAEAAHVKLLERRASSPIFAAPGEASAPQHGIAAARQAAAEAEALALRSWRRAQDGRLASTLLAAQQTPPPPPG